MLLSNSELQYHGAAEHRPASLPSSTACRQFARLRSTTGTRRQCHPCKAQVGKLNAADERYISFKYSRMVAKSCAIALPRFIDPTMRGEGATRFSLATEIATGRASIERYSAFGEFQARASYKIVI